MKNIGDSSSSASNLPSAPPADADLATLSEHRRAHGRRLEVAEDYELVDLLHAYAESSIAQVNSLVATSKVVVQDVAYVLGLTGAQLDDVYEFASFTETVARHRETGNDASADAKEPDEAGSSEADGAGSSGVAGADGLAAAERADSAAGSDDASATEATSDRFPPTSLAALTAAEAAAWAEAKTQVEAETGTTFAKGKGQKKNRAAGRLLRRAAERAEEILSNPAPLPDFPGYEPTQTFFTWLRGNLEPTEAGVYSSLLGATTSNALRHMTASMTFAHGLPKFLRRCLDGDFTIEHVDCVTRACRDLHFENLPTIDRFLAQRRADITIETFKRSLAFKIAATQAPEDTLKNVALRRRVDLTTGDDGTAHLTLTGPAPELQACFRRLDAFARAVYKSNTSAFSDQLKSGDCFDEDQSISALMFDILTRTRPQMKLRIISTNDADGASTSTDFPLDGLFAGPDGVPMHEGESLLDYIERVFDDLHETGYAEASGEKSVSNETEAGAEAFVGPELDTAPGAGPEDETGTGTEADVAETIGSAAASAGTTTPADRTFESQILEAILSSNTSHEATGHPTNAGARNAMTTTDFGAQNSVNRTDINDALSSLIGSRASGARPAAEGTEAAADGAVDAFGNTIRNEGGHRISFEFLLDMPTSEYWLANQASTFITVPMLTLLSQFTNRVDGEGSQAPAPAGEAEERPTATAFADTTDPPPHHGGPPTPPESPTTTTPTPPATTLTPNTDAATPAAKQLSSEEVCDLAGMLPDGSPIPADMARRVAGYSTTWTRLLTDPATGTPIDAKAKTYAIPNNVRKTLVAQYVTCTFPGCTLPAETSEVDHIDPFDHADPNRGGLTRFGNIHCLCKLHHSLKTAKKFDVRMTEPGHLEYVFRRGVTVEVIAPDNPLNVEHARLFLERFGSAMPRANRPVASELPTDDTPSTEETPARGQRRQARECPEPAAAEGQPGWREAPSDPFAAYVDASDSHTDSTELRDWFWDSGEPPPF
ncbi:HNH endonuclease signature motif containing protein [Brevibacterium oceani]|uniref:HNH endonuclease signature motif containing protein n=1 Tax=Brevibacterium oceani TaxID=358099 RepID=UPI0015E7C34A|nr:HNH endonuclease signature motif containing protein [Brevibacterium oceani]